MSSSRLRSARLYAILDTGYVAPAQWVRLAQMLVAGGADLIQIRAKDQPVDAVRRLIQPLLPLVHTTPQVAWVVNDHLELAQEYGLGLHVGQDDLAPEEARRALGPQAVLGLSTHSPAQIAGALALGEVLSYFAVGPVFATPTKPQYAAVGLDLVRHAAAQRPPTPWFAIGGIKLHNLPEVLAAGAERVVIVSGLLQADDPSAAGRAAKAQLATTGKGAGTSA